MIPRIERVTASSLFHRSYKRASPDLKRVIKRWISDLVDASRHPEQNSKLDLKRLKVINFWRLSGRNSKEYGGYRVFIDFENGTLQCLDFDDHDYYEHLNHRALKNAKEDQHPWNEFEVSNRKSGKLNKSDRFTEEQQNEKWLFTLDDQQSAASDEIFDTFLSNPKEHYEFHLVGGPGTGKTSVLITLFDALVDEYPGALYVCPPNLKTFLEAWGQTGKGKWISMEDPKLESKVSQAKVVFVDDPHNKQEIDRIIDARRTTNGQLMVFAYDPDQLQALDLKDDPFTDADFEKYEREGGCIIELHQCYRQRANIFEAVKPIIINLSTATKYLADEKIAREQRLRQWVQQLTSKLEPTNPGGLFCQKQLGTEEGAFEMGIPTLFEMWLPTLNEAVASITPWKNWPSMLIIYDDTDSLQRSTMLRQILFVLEYEFSTIARIEPLSNSKSIQGTEFQHVLILTTAQVVKDLTEGFKGKGGKETNRLRAMRVPISRARDSLFLIAVH